MADARKCATCRKYWAKQKQCRAKAPDPVPMINVKQVQHGTMWLTVDGEGCDEWESREGGDRPIPQMAEAENPADAP